MIFRVWSYFPMSDPCKGIKGCGHLEATRCGCDEHTGILRNCREMKSKPRASTHAICSMKVTRECVHTATSIAASYGGKLVLPVGDLGIIQSSEALQTNKTLKMPRRKG